ncbi:MAG: FtsQ-type POTRA domain-containing protein [Deltaproteobacteria bacterium]
MQDFATSTYQRRKVAPNRVKVKREPIDLAKYLRPFRSMAIYLAVAVIVCTIVLVAYRVVNATTFCRLKTIEVSSSQHLSREDILAVTGIEPGKDLLRFNLKLMGEQLARNPWVETVHIRRFLPDGIAISVIEREPLAVVNMGFIYYMDKKGTIFKVLNQGDRLDYPVITGFTEDDMNNDQIGTREALKKTCELLKILFEKGAFILADVSEIHYDKDLGFTMFTASGALPVKIGSGDFVAKLERFARIYRELMSQRPSLRYIDIDYNDRIVIKRS